MAFVRGRVVAVPRVPIIDTNAGGRTWGAPVASGGMSGRGQAVRRCRPTLLGKDTGVTGIPVFVSVWDSGD